LTFIVTKETKAGKNMKKNKATSIIKPKTETKRKFCLPRLNLATPENKSEHLSETMKISK